MITSFGSDEVDIEDQLAIRSIDEHYDLFKVEMVKQDNMLGVYVVLARQQERAYRSVVEKGHRGANAMNEYIALERLVGELKEGLIELPEKLTVNG